MAGHSESADYYMHIHQEEVIDRDIVYWVAYNDGRGMRAEQDSRTELIACNHCASSCCIQYRGVLMHP